MGCRQACRFKASLGLERKPTGLGRGGHCFHWSHVVQVKRAKFGSGILPAKLANYSSACAIWEMKGRMLRFFPFFFFSATLGNHDAESELENGARSTEQSRCLATKVASNQYFSVATAIAWMPRRTTLLNTIMKHRTTAEKLRSATHFAFMRVFSEVKLIEGSMCWGAMVTCRVSSSIFQQTSNK